MLLRAVEVWFVLLMMAVLNGGAREALITPQFGSFAGHIISTIMLSTGIVFMAWMSILWIGAESAADAFAVGSTWLLLTVGFEFVAGHYLFRTPWKKLIADYNIFQGRIWVVVPLFTLLAPIWALWQRRAAPSTNISTVIVFVIIAWASVGAAWQFMRMVREWRRLAGVRLVTCTRTGYPAAVRLEAVRAVLTTLVSPKPKAAIADCSFWTSSGSCDQGCITEALEPESTVQSIVTRWYEKKKCVYCAKPIAVLQSFNHRAALLSPQGTTREWSELPADRLLDSLRTDSPVCWNCHVAETFRRAHPDLITDRPSAKQPDRRAG